MNKLGLKLSKQGGLGLPIPRLNYDNLGRFLAFEGDGTFLPTKKILMRFSDHNAISCSIRLL